MSLDRLVDSQITRAIAEGEFENLPGKGKPLDLDWYFNLPEDLRLTYSVLKNANCAPEETQLIKDIAQLKTRLEATVTQDERAKIKRQIQQKTLGLSVIIERNQRRK